MTALGIKAGCDQNDGRTYNDNGMAAIKAGLITEDDIDRALSRVLTQRFRVGAFDPKAEVSFRTIPTTELDAPAHRQLSLQAAREAITLLANVESTLPLSTEASSGMKIGLIGPFADNIEALRGGKPDYHPNFVITPLQGITDMAKSLKLPPVRFAAGSSVTNTSSDPEGTPPPSLAAAVAVAASSDVVVICVGIDASIEHEGTDRTYIGLPPVQLALLKAVAAAAAPKRAKVSAAPHFFLSHFLLFYLSIL